MVLPSMVEMSGGGIIRATVSSDPSHIIVTDLICITVYLSVTTPTPGTPSRRKGSVFLLRRFELLPGLQGIFRTTKQGKAAQGQESANDECGDHAG